MAASEGMLGYYVRNLLLYSVLQSVRGAGEGVGPRSTFSFWSTKCLDESRTSVDPIDGFKSLGKSHGHHVNLLWPLHEFLIFIGTFQHVSHK